MLVYDTMDKGPNGVHNLQVTPAKVDPSVTVEQWRDKDGNPETILVTFRNGVANVDDSLGRFLVGHGYAKKTRPLYRA